MAIKEKNQSNCQHMMMEFSGWSKERKLMKESKINKKILSMKKL
jgi:hypothetical protein